MQSCQSYPAAAHPGTDTTSRTDSDKPSQALFLWRGSSATLCPTPVALTGVSRLAASGRHLEQKLGRTADATPGTEMPQNHDRCTWASRAGGGHWIKGGAGIKREEAEDTESRAVSLLLQKRQRPTLPPGGAVPSARPGLTSLFGMGRGGAPAL